MVWEIRGETNERPPAQNVSGFGLRNSGFGIRDSGSGFRVHNAEGRDQREEVDVSLLVGRHHKRPPSGEADSRRSAQGVGFS
jgi:hypothetical protein